MARIVVDSTVWKRIRVQDFSSPSSVQHSDTRFTNLFRDSYMPAGIHCQLALTLASALTRTFRKQSFHIGESWRVRKIFLTRSLFLHLEFCRRLFEFVRTGHKQLGAQIESARIAAHSIDYGGTE
jgi:hypothetical protein